MITICYWNKTDVENITWQNFSSLCDEINRKNSFLMNSRRRKTKQILFHRINLFLHTNKKNPKPMKMRVKWEMMLLTDGNYLWYSTGEICVCAYLNNIYKNMQNKIGRTEEEDESDSLWLSNIEEWWIIEKEKREKNKRTFRDVFLTDYENRFDFINESFSWIDVHWLLE